MAPSHSRQLLVCTLPTIVVLLSYLWYKRKRIGSQSDPGDAEKSVRIRKEEPEEIEEETSPNKSFSRSLSGVDSAPIDIVIPPELKAVRSNPVVISDEDLDLEIEKIKSMKYGGSIDLRQNTPPKIAVSVKANSPPSTKMSSTPVSQKSVPDCLEESPEMAQEIMENCTGPATTNVMPQEIVEKCTGPATTDVMPQEIVEECTGPATTDVMPQEVVEKCTGPATTDVMPQEIVEKCTGPATTDVMPQEIVEECTGPATTDVMPQEVVENCTGSATTDVMPQEIVEKCTGPATTDVMPQEIVEECTGPATTDVMPQEIVEKCTGPATTDVMPQEIVEKCTGPATTDVMPQEIVEECTGPATTDVMPQEVVEKCTGPATTDVMPQEIVENCTGPATTDVMPQEIVEKCTGPATTDVMSQEIVENCTGPATTDVMPQEDDIGNEQFIRHNSERDSANHSPIDVIMASPSLSSISDNHSEGSNDSGKGGSEVTTPPPSRNPSIFFNPFAGPCNLIYYDFMMPQGLVGKLIGKRGSYVRLIKEKTGGNVLVRRDKTKGLKLTTVEGTSEQIAAALRMIRNKFPLKRYPDVTLEEVTFRLEDAPKVTASPLSVSLIEGVTNDTIMCCLVEPDHLFLQQPTHPSFPVFTFSRCVLNNVYNDTSPALPTPIRPNTLCIVFTMGQWLRGTILSTDETTQKAYVRLIDDGGYTFVKYRHLKQIRADFMLIPFQAAECFLYNVQPIDEDGWSDSARRFIASVMNSVIVSTHIMAYTETGIPLVNCYVRTDRIIFVNAELVNRGFAQWIHYLEEPIEDAVAVAEPL